ncbi:MAG: TraR/DksA C4-type zinc finger protein [Chthoniobacterales bacterium]
MAKPQKKSSKSAGKPAKAKGGKKPVAHASKPKKAKASKPSAKVKTPVKAKAAKKPLKPKAIAKPAAKPVKAVKKVAAKPAPAKAKVKELPEPPVKKIRPLNDPFLKKQRERLLQLKDTLLDSMSGVARDSLRSTEGNDASAFGMHQADAGSDAYDRDFALSLISQEQDALYEIDEALKRIDNGTYGTCEMSGKHVPRARLEALPFTRYTVECQAELEKTNRYRRLRQPVTSLFGLGDDESDDDDDSTPDSKE